MESHAILIETLGECVPSYATVKNWVAQIKRGGFCTCDAPRPGQGTSQVEKSPRLIWATQFLMAAYDGAHSPSVSFRMAWISFGTLPCRKKTLWQIASPCCWNRTRSLTCFLSTSVTRKDLQFGTWTDPSFRRHYRFRPTTSGSRSG